MIPKTNSRNKKIAMIAIIALVLVLILANIVYAQSIFQKASNGFKNVGSKISSSKVGVYFSNYSRNNEPTFFDFFIFFVIFMSLCYIGFTQAFKEAGKGPLVGLSVALAIALSAALVWGGKVTVKKMLPFALVVLALAIVLLVYSLLTKYLFKSESTGAKVAAFIIAVIIAIILIYLLVSMICFQNRCSNIPILNKLFGGESFFGKIKTDIGYIFKGPTISSGTASKTNVATPATGNTPPTTAGALRNATSKTAATGPSYKSFAMPGLALLLVLGMMGFIWWRSKKAKKERELIGAPPGTKKKSKEEQALFERFIGFLEKLLSSQKQRKQDFMKTKEELKQEGAEFSKEDHIVEELKTDIKDTIGEELDKIKWAETEGLDLDKISKHNEVELKHVKSILDSIKKDGNRITEIQENLHDLNDVITQYGVAGEVIEQMKQLQMQNAETSQKVDAKDLEKMRNTLITLNRGFTKFAKSCEDARTYLHESSSTLKEFKSGKGFRSYQDLVQRIIDLKTHFAHLNELFSQKVIVFRQLAAQLKIIDEEIGKIEHDEIEKIERLAGIMKKAYEEKRYDKSSQFALLVEQNATIYMQRDKQLISNIEEKGVALPPSIKARHDRLEALINEAKSYKLGCERELHQSLPAHIAKDMAEAISDTDLHRAEQKLLHALKTSPEPTIEYLKMLQRLFSLMKKTKELQQELVRMNRSPVTKDRLDDYSKALSKIETVMHEKVDEDFKKLHSDDSLTAKKLLPYVTQIREKSIGFERRKALETIKKMKQLLINDDALLIELKELNKEVDKRTITDDDMPAYAKAFDSLSEEEVDKVTEEATEMEKSDTELGMALIPLMTEIPFGLQNKQAEVYDIAKESFEEYPDKPKEAIDQLELAVANAKRRRSNEIADVLEKTLAKMEVASGYKVKRTDVRSEEAKRLTEERRKAAKEEKKTRDVEAKKIRQDDIIKSYPVLTEPKAFVNQEITTHYIAENQPKMKPFISLAEEYAKLHLVILKRVYESSRRDSVQGLKEIDEDIQPLMGPRYRFSDLEAKYRDLEGEFKAMGIKVKDILEADKDLLLGIHKSVNNFRSGLKKEARSALNTEREFLEHVSKGIGVEKVKMSSSNFSMYEDILQNLSELYNRIDSGKVKPKEEPRKGSVPAPETLAEKRFVNVNSKTRKKAFDGLKNAMTESDIDKASQSLLDNCPVDDKLAFQKFTEKTKEIEMVHLRYINSLPTENQEKTTILRSAQSKLSVEVKKETWDKIVEAFNELPKTDQAMAKKILLTLRVERDIFDIVRESVDKALVMKVQEAQKLIKDAVKLAEEKTSGKIINRDRELSNRKGKAILTSIRQIRGIIERKSVPNTAFAGGIPKMEDGKIIK